jgi:hypothetical protein
MPPISKQRVQFAPVEAGLQSAIVAAMRSFERSMSGLIVEPHRTRTGMPILSAPPGEHCLALIRESGLTNAILKGLPWMLFIGTRGIYWHQRIAASEPGKLPDFRTQLIPYGKLSKYDIGVRRETFWGLGPQLVSVGGHEIDVAFQTPTKIVAVLTAIKQLLAR